MITLEDALTANEFWHMTERNADGSPLRRARSGETKTWKKWPDLFCIPVTYGSGSWFYIANFDWRYGNVPAYSTQGRNDMDWCTPAKWPAEHVLFEGLTTGLVACARVRQGDHKPTDPGQPVADNKVSIVKLVRR